MSCRRYDDKAFHTRGLAAEKLLSPKLLCVHGMTHILSDMDRRWGRPVLVVSWMLEARYDGVCSANDWWTRHASLNSNLSRTWSQCNFCRMGVMCSHRQVPVIRYVEWVMVFENFCRSQPSRQLLSSCICCFITSFFVLRLLVVGSRYQFRVVAVYSNHDNMHGPNSERVRLRVDGRPSVRAPQSAPTIVETYSISSSTIFVKWQVNKLFWLTSSAAV